MQIATNYSNQNFARVLIINQQEIKLITVGQGGICVKCQKDKEIRLICEKKIWVGTAETYQDKKYCGSCALNALYQLEESNHDFTNKDQIIRELRAELNTAITNKTTEISHACKHCPPNTQQTLTQHIHTHKWFERKDNWPVWRCKNWPENKDGNISKESIN